jgi:hypothetical protein
MFFATAIYLGSFAGILFLPCMLLFRCRDHPLPWGKSKTGKTGGFCAKNSGGNRSFWHAAIKIAKPSSFGCTTRAVVPTGCHGVSQQREEGLEKLKNGQRRRLLRKWEGFEWEGGEWTRGSEMAEGRGEAFIALGVFLYL